MTPEGQRLQGGEDAFTLSLWACVCCVFLMMGTWRWKVTRVEGHRGSREHPPLVFGCMSRHPRRKRDRKKATERWSERATGKEICHFNGHFYGLGELGGSQTSPSLTTVQQTPDRCISVWAFLSPSERQMYLSNSPQRIGFKWLLGGAERSQLVTERS